MATDFGGLPEAERVHAGIRDLRAQVVSEASLLVTVAAPALRRLEIDVPQLSPAVDDPNLSLYRWLQQADAKDPYRRYNALIRGMVSFVRALEARKRRRGHAPTPQTA